MHSASLPPSTSMIILRSSFHQARMVEIERNGDAGRVVRAEPFVGQPDMRVDVDAALFQFVIELHHATLDPGALDGEVEILEAQFQQFLVRQ